MPYDDGMSIIVDMEGGIVFGEDPRPLGPRRRARALEYLTEALAKAAPDAVDFQVELIKEASVSDDVRMKKLGFDASEAILDRFAGKAAQEVRVSDAHDRPIVFDSKLAILKEAMDASLSKADGRPLIERFNDEVEARTEDQGPRIK